MIKSNTLRKSFLIFSLMVFVSFFLSSCTTVVKDGPPKYDVDVSKIPNANPKNEPLSKIGNKPTYEVFGKKYYVMHSSKNYKERGIASWYGTKFHHRQTTSGERYDMLAMTAAHKSLPLPTYVEVTNLSNGKKVVVKVNDRGPFVGDRLIDLSYAAAKKLGITGHGTAKVEVVAIDPKTYFKPPTPVLAKNAKVIPVYLQVGTFQNKSRAETLQKKLTTLLSTPVRITELNKGKKMYRVQIGPIQDSNTIGRVNKQLKSIGLNSRELIA